MYKVNLIGKEFHFGIGFLNYAIDEMKVPFQEIALDLDRNTISIVPKLMYYSLAYSYQRQNKELDFTKEDVFDWIDGNGGVKIDENGQLIQGFYTDFINALVKSLYKDVPTDNTKKKVSRKQ